MDNWNLPKSYLMSMGLWISVYSFEYLTRSEEFTRLYPDGYQCLIVAITVYPGIGLSVLFGHVVGKVIKIFFDANQEHTESIEKTKKFTWIKK
ncbi:MAG: hypothetical protein EOO68_23515 [Moraxellaceae bacterium]|nr:MAG: hypothetical protein EOO68_23515 [Moraxellaceae bacterium]